jgi:hypothetical protein
MAANVDIRLRLSTFSEFGLNSRDLVSGGRVFQLRTKIEHIGACVNITFARIHSPDPEIPEHFAPDI